MWDLTWCPSGVYGSHMNTNPDTQKTVTDCIVAAITAAERNQKWTAEKAAIPESTFYRKLRLGGDFKASELKRIALALGVRTSALIPDDEFLRAA